MFSVIIMSNPWKYVKAGSVAGNPYFQLDPIPPNNPLPASVGEYILMPQTTTYAFGVHVLQEKCVSENNVHQPKIVVVGRDSTVQSLKGVAPQQSEHERLQAVAAHPLVGHAVLGEQLDFYQVVRQQQPAVIILGYDQVSPMTKGLADAFPNIQIIRGQAFEPETYKSSKLRHAKTADRHA